MRPHVSVIVTAFYDSTIPNILRLYGATISFIHSETLIDTLRQSTSSSLTADAIVIDGTTLVAQSFIRAAALSRAIRGLVDSKMRTGVRWSAIPIILVVKDDATMSAVSFDFTRYGVTSCALSAEWSYVYDVSLIAF
jgi:hypothetical protein